jgi:hypothetical protein
VLDLVPDIDPSEWAPFDLARLERYLESVLGPLIVSSSICATIRQ